MFVVDTNILLYAADKNAAEHNLCRKLLLSWRSQAFPWYLTYGIVYEFLRVSTHPRVFRKPFTLANSWGFIQALMASESLSIITETKNHALVASEVFETIPNISGNLIFDARTAILMREHGIKTIYTRDNDFHKFPFLKVIDPLQN